jgi:hypothetical protein
MRFNKSVNADAQGRSAAAPRRSLVAVTSDVMAHEMQRETHRSCWLPAVFGMAFHQRAMAHGQEAIVAVALILVESIAAVLVAVFISTLEAERYRRAAPGGRGFLRGVLWMFVSLGSWLVVSLIAGGLYAFVFNPQGMYPASVPFGVTVSTIALVLWYFQKRRQRKLQEHAP